MTTGPWLSVVMPTYRGVAHVADALASIERELAGRADDVEVVVADDGSDDATTDIVASFSDRLPLVLLPPRRRGSWVAAVNDGFAVARGTWSCMLHQDDHWVPGRLAGLAPAVRTAEASGAELIVHGVQMVDDRGRAAGRWRPPFAAGPIDAARAVQSLLVQNWVSVPGATFRTASVQDRPLDVDLWYTADWDLWLRLSQTAGLVVADGEWAAFRLHAGSQTVVGSGDLAGFRAQHEVVRARYPLTGADASARIAARVARAGRLSIETNVLFAALAQRGERTVRPWAKAATASPAVWAMFLRHSRIRERSLSRVRAGLLARRS